MTVRPIMLFVLLAAGASGVAAQQPSTPPLSRDEIAALARVEVAIARIRDTLGAQLTQVRNKKDEQQKELRDRLQSQIAAVLLASGLSEAEYRRRTFVISSDMAARKTYDSVVVAVTGMALPGLLPPAPPAVRLPAGPVGTHIGHVVNSFNGTPANVGLLTVAAAEARIAATHAQLATRQPTNLDYMKTHAGHVLHALDPALISAGPGQNYGAKKAAEGVATHIELAAAVPGASGNVQLHARHIATCARNTMQRADALIALAQQVMASTSAAEAFPLVGRMAALADQLMSGADANADGRITVDPGEGGLSAADDHAKLMLAVEVP